MVVKKRMTQEERDESCSACGGSGKLKKTKTACSACGGTGKKKKK